MVVKSYTRDTATLRFLIFDGLAAVASDIDIPALIADKLTDAIFKSLLNAGYGLRDASAAYHEDAEQRAARVASALISHGPECRGTLCTCGYEQSFQRAKRLIAETIENDRMDQNRRREIVKATQPRPWYRRIFIDGE